MRWFEYVCILLWMPHPKAYHLFNDRTILFTPVAYKGMSLTQQANNKSYTSAERKNHEKTHV